MTGRAGRVLLGDHDDGWGVGGAAGVLFLFTPTVGLELGYEALWLFPDSFCADLDTCVDPRAGDRRPLRFLTPT